MDIKRIHEHRHGYISIALLLGLTFLLSMVGLAVDVGRMYITKSEAQSFVDSAAMAAAVQLDGSAAGVTRATSAVATDPKKWGFGLKTFATVTTRFSNSSTGPWVNLPPSPPTGYYYAQVSTTVTLPMYLMRVMGVTDSQIAATAVSGRTRVPNMVNGGEFPFSPYTRTASPDNASDPYGYLIGNLYTLRWGAPGNRHLRDRRHAFFARYQRERSGLLLCGGERGKYPRGIVSADTDPVAVAGNVPMGWRERYRNVSIALRVNMDSDTTSTTYSQYRTNGWGNGERVVFVPNQ